MKQALTMTQLITLGDWLSRDAQANANSKCFVSLYQATMHKLEDCVTATKVEVEKDKDKDVNCYRFAERD